MLGPLWGQPQTRSSACDRATDVDAAFVRLVSLALPVSMRRAVFLGSHLAPVRWASLCVRGALSEKRPENLLASRWRSGVGVRVRMKILLASVRH